MSSQACGTRGRARAWLTELPVGTPARVVIFGHSWGSALGLLYAARFPDKVMAYVGCGQIGDWPASESASYAFALSEAQRRGNRRAVRKLLAPKAIARPPPPAPLRLGEFRGERNSGKSLAWSVVPSSSGSRRSACWSASGELILIGIWCRYWC